jgi:glycosyltransferase involved in cell wall biosynthesis
MTDVPPNTAELARDAGAEVVADNPSAFADAIERLLASPDEWSRRHRAALSYAQQFDWNSIVGSALQAAGFES